MRRLLTFSLALALGAVSVQAAPIRKAAQPIKDQYIVVLNSQEPSLRGLGVPLAARSLAAQHGASVRHLYQAALQGFAVTMTEEQALAMAADPAVAYVEEDQMMYASATQNNATWGLDRIDQRALPLNTTYVFDVTGAGVNAYVIDTGIRISHSQFGGRARAAHTSINDGRGSDDCNGHGTHVAGTIGGSTWGVAKGVALHAVRVLDCGGSGSNSGVIAGVDFVTRNHRKPAVANMSLGGGVSAALDAAVRGSIAAGVTYAIAAGNSNSNACAGSPSRVREALIVGATMRTDARASFSSFGPCVDLFAPGVGITSAWITSASATLSGTSMATPHVAGVAALVLQRTPGATAAAVHAAIVNAATAGRVIGPGGGSPNRLLFSR